MQYMQWLKSIAKNNKRRYTIVAKVELKQPIVEEISDNIKDAQSVVVVNYRGLTVAEDTELRKALREAGVTYKVYKNTLVSRAVEGTDFAALKDVLEGPNAFAISTTEFQKRMQPLLSESLTILQRKLRHLSSRVQ